MTHEQIIKKYFEIYRNTQKIDHKKVEEILRKIYSFKNIFDEPAIIWAKSPKQANVANEILEKLPSKDYLKAQELFDIAISKGQKSSKKFKNNGGGNLCAAIAAGQEIFLNEKDNKRIYLPEHETDLKEYLLYLDMIIHGSIWYQWERVVVAVERPVVCDVKLLPDFKMLFHSETGPVISWEDGYKMFFLNNIRVPEWLVMNAPEDIDPIKYFEEKNIEVKREICRKIGWPRMIKHFNALLIDTWQPKVTEITYADELAEILKTNIVNKYELYNLEIPVNGETISARGLFMKLMDKTGLVSEYFEFVEDNMINSARDAFFKNRPELSVDEQIILS